MVLAVGAVCALGWLIGNIEDYARRDGVGPGYRAVMYGLVVGPFVTLIVLFIVGLLALAWR